MLGNNQQVWTAGVEDLKCGLGWILVIHINVWQLRSGSGDVDSVELQPAHQT